jgi:subtilisin family serine protease
MVLAIISSPALPITEQFDDGNSSFSEEEIYYAWVEFADKDIRSEKHLQELLAEMEEYFDSRAIERRKKRRTLPGLFDERDLPVVDGYLEGVADTGARLMAVSRWLNGVSIKATIEQMEKIEVLPYVTGVLNPHIPDPEGDYMSFPERAEKIDHGPYEDENSRYGRSGPQVRQLGLDRMHDAGFTGKEVIVAVLDTGFDLDHTAFNHPDHPLKVIAEWDFVENDAITGPQTGSPDPQYHYQHGTYILGTMAAYMPGEYVGSAFDASFILCKAEHDADEFLLEEYWFVSALEYAEAHGADIVSSSLGLYVGYGQDQMDGKTTVMSRGWKLAVDNGIIGFQGVGNFGHDDDPSVSHLFAPADAFGVVAVGAVDEDGAIARFSSDGPTSDGRLKPELLARGLATWTISMNDREGYVTASGTSLATPVMAGAVACLLQVNPDWSNADLIEALTLSGDYYLRHGQPDPLSVHGYGIPDLFAAAGYKTPR